MRLEIYRARRGVLRRQQWRARVVSSNGKVLFANAESYNNVDDLLKVTSQLFPNLEPKGAPQ